MKNSELIRKAIETLEQVDYTTVTSGTEKVIPPVEKNAIVKDLLFMEYKFQQHEKWMESQYKRKRNPHDDVYYGKGKE